MQGHWVHQNLVRVMRVKWDIVKGIELKGAKQIFKGRIKAAGMVSPLL